MPAVLAKVDLFAHLEHGHAAQVTVVTPNKRLSQSLQAEFDAHQTARGLAVWDAPDILPFGALVERMWEDALYSDLGQKLPLLLTPAQEQHVWQEILHDSGFLLREGAALQCREAWRLMHEWRIGTGSATEDAAAFSGWVKKYERKAAGEIDAARLPDLMAQHLVKKPKLVVAYGFDVMPPQTREFLDRLDYQECIPDPVEASCSRTSYPSAGHEIEAAAKWARTRLENRGQSPISPRIAVVVPDLHKRRAEVARVFSRVMHPGYNLPGAPKAQMPFNVSFGKALAAYPLVHAALGLLEFAFQPVEFAKASHLIRSPFLGGADTELARRAALDVKLRRDGEASLSLAKLVGLSESCPILRSLLEKVLAVSREKRADSPAAWARQFSALLEAAGFPGERALDSDEFQTRAKWHDALAELARLERIAPQFSFDQAFSFLQQLCAGTLFQPESADAPIQILGVLESAGLRFDCLWVCGLTDEQWPLPVAPNPFIPMAAQRKAGIPQASAEGSAERDRRITEQWKRAAAEVVFSWPEKDKDKNLSPSPLIDDIEIKKIAVPEFSRYRDLLFASRKLETFQDAKGPAVAPGKVRGGTRVLADHSACPFRAFARWRLNAEELEEPASGLDARDRGKMLHVMMSQLWGALRNSRALRSELGPAIARAADFAVKDMKLEGRFAELERERLAKTAREWLELEKRREPFDVEAVEQQRDLKVAGLEFQSRIDRMDRLEDGSHVLIDYKGTRMLSINAWAGPRPRDPQLPLYAVAAPEKLAAVAFAKVATGEMRFMGLSRRPNLLPEVKPAEDWPGLLREWKQHAEALGKSFAAGEAQVDPKEGLKTCRLCALHTLCRVYEKTNVLEGDA